VPSWLCSRQSAPLLALVCHPCAHPAAVRVQLPYPACTVVPGMLKIGVLRFSLAFKTRQWRVTLRRDWLAHALASGAAGGSNDLSPWVRDFSWVRGHGRHGVTPRRRVWL
jgi:hypothetical protein